MEARDTHPVIIKQVMLAGEQLRRFREQDAVRRATMDVLSTVLKKASEGLALDRAEMWDALAKMLGFSNIDAAYTQGKVITVDWITGMLTLRGQEPSPEPETQTKGD